MIYKGTQMVTFMESQLGDRGAAARKYCGLGPGQPWCNAEVSYAFYKQGIRMLYCNGRKEVGCPHSINWCYDNWAVIPIYLAMGGDVIYFDWNGNKLPDHIGFVLSRISDVQIKTIEGNTSGGKVDIKIRPVKDVQAVFRPHYPVASHMYDTSKKLEIDGLFGFNSIACLQKALLLKVDGVLGIQTVKALQSAAGVKADGIWGTKTTKAVQKMVGAKVDGCCGPETVKKLQKWINKQNDTNLSKWTTARKTQYEWSKNQEYKWVIPTIKSSKKKGTCITFHSVALQRLGLLKSGEYFYYSPDTHKITGNAAKYVLSHSELFEVMYPHKTIAQLGDKIKPGDIIGFGNPYYHSMIYRGKNKKGEPLFDTMGSKRGLGIRYPYYANRKVDMIVRLKKTEV